MFNYKYFLKFLNKKLLSEKLKLIRPSYLAFLGGFIKLGRFRRFKAKFPRFLKV